MEPAMQYYGKYASIGIVAGAITYVVFAATIFSPLAILPPIMVVAIASYLRRKAIAVYEGRFSTFLGDLRDLLQGGMPMVTALETVSKNNYGKFSELVKRMAAQARFGLSFEKILRVTLGDIDSPIIKKTIYVITETHKRGGNLIQVFNATAKYVTAIERLKEERRSRTYASLFSTYVMFFIFLGIIIAIQAFFLPLMRQTVVFQAQRAVPVDFEMFFLYLIIVQSIFSGPMIGKISENSLTAGLRHSLVLLAVSIPVYVIAGAFY